MHFQTKNDDDFCPSPDYIWEKSQGFTNKNDQTDFEEEVLRYTKENVAMVTIYIREPFAEEILISEITTIFELMSDIGGLMGLFMGCSFVSAVEIIYHILKVTSPQSSDYRSWTHIVQSGRSILQQSNYYFCKCP